ncbi:MAG: TonB family protein [Nitrospira sp.]|nr:TonB family protein [Nitrospira sp.]
MPGYVGYHSSKKRSWSATTTIVVVVAHVIVLAVIYQLSRTEYIQNLIKVSKLTTVQEPVKPPEPPPPEETPEPESPPEPELPPEPPPVVSELPPEPAPQPIQEIPPAPPSLGERADPAPVDTAPFAIGKGRSRFALYEDLLMGSIQALYRQPPELPEDLEYAVLCELVLDEDGYVLAYKLLNSSGNALFDRSAQLALSRLRHVRPPPPGMSRTVVVKFFPP